MKIKFLILIFLSPAFCFADNFHNHLIIPGVNVDDPIWEFNQQPIAERNKGDFAKLVKKWTEQLNNVWISLTLKIKDEIHASSSQIDYYLEDQRFIDVYINYYRNFFGQCMDNQEPIDPFILNFIVGKLNYLQANKNIKICTKESLPFLTVCFGADQAGHYLILNEAIYSKEKIREMYDIFLTKKPKFFIEPATSCHLSRIIECNNLFHLEMARALSSVHHQHDYFAKMLIIFIFNKKVLTQDVQTYGANYTIFQSYLEACLQSKNPLEAAIFMEPYLDNFNQEYVILWRQFIQDLENCYNEDDLAAYQEFATYHRRQVLYSQDE